MNHVRIRALKKVAKIFYLLLFLGLVPFFFPVFYPETLTVASAAEPISSEILKKALLENLDKVEEFKAIREKANQLGVKVYLFGGTAASYSHYVKWDLERLNGDTRFQADRFDYDFTNIFRSTQDLDIVLDGPAQLIPEFQNFLSTKFPFFKGGKAESWEVRSLRNEAVGKIPLLNNPDFINQHTDSNSTGMIDLTTNNVNEVVKDLRDWKNENPFFLEDIRQGKLHYYFSDKHSTTRYFKEGINPPIVSVIRYLTKAFQYDLEILPEDEKIIRRIITAFDPKSVNNGQLANWLEKHSKKLFLHAVNLEYARNKLEELGLRKKLISLKSNIGEIDSLAWWLERQPLPSLDIKAAPIINGKKLPTAQELNIDIVAHETNSFEAYESINRSPKGAPNVFISRPGREGEAAVKGPGFYTRIGREGARGTDITIRFKMNPLAVENIDFKQIGDHVLILNKNAITIIPESLNISALEYYQMLIAGQGIDSRELGVLEKIKRRIKNRLANFSNEDRSKIQALLQEYFKGRPNIHLLEEFWGKQGLVWAYPEHIKNWLNILIDKNNPDFNHIIIENVLSSPENLKKFETEFNRIIKQPDFYTYKRIFQYIYTQPESIQWERQLKEIYFSNEFKQVNHSGSLTDIIISNILSKPHSVHFKDLIDKIILETNRGYKHYLRMTLFEAEHAPELEKQLLVLLEGCRQVELIDIAKRALTKKHFEKLPQVKRRFIEKWVDHYKYSLNKDFKVNKTIFEDALNLFFPLDEPNAYYEKPPLPFEDLKNVDKHMVEAIQIIDSEKRTQYLDQHFGPRSTLVEEAIKGQRHLNLAEIKEGIRDVSNLIANYEDLAKDEKKEIFDRIKSQLYFNDYSFQELAALLEHFMLKDLEKPFRQQGATLYSHYIKSLKEIGAYSSIKAIRILLQRVDFARKNSIEHDANEAISYLRKYGRNLPKLGIDNQILFSITCEKDLRQAVFKAAKEKN